MTVKLTAEEMRFIALFEGIAGARIKDCVITPDGSTIAFVVKEGNMGLAIGKNGARIKKMERLTGKNVEIYEASSDPISFLKNLLSPAQVLSVEAAGSESGKILMVRVVAGDKTKAIGRRGYKLLLAKKLMQRHFEISDIIFK